MIATTRGLVVLAVLAATLLLGSVLADRSQRPRAGGTSPAAYLLVPDFDEKQVTEIHIAWAGGARESIRRVGEQWRIDERTLADPATIDAIFAALRGARFHRRAPRSEIREPREPRGPSNIALGSLRFSIGPSIDGLQQTWLVREGEAFLVDDWVVRALVPDPLALRVRHPIECGSAQTITATTAKGRLRIEGRRVVEPYTMWISEDWWKAIAEACAAIELRSLDGRGDGRQGLHVVADGELTEAGGCHAQQLTYIESPTTRGCVATEALVNLASVLGRTIIRPQDALDMRPLPIVPVELTLQDGAVLALSKQPRIADHDADPDRVSALLAALAKQGAEIADRPTGKPRGIIRALDGAGTEVMLELYDHVIARAGEPRAIRIADREWAIITSPSALLRDATRWREEPTTISAVAIDNVSYKRGAVLGEWTREPAGPLHPALVDAVVETVATLRAPVAAPPSAIAHRVRITVTPPAGAPVTHAIELAAPTDLGCAARVDRAPALLPLPVCTAVAALAAQQK